MRAVFHHLGLPESLPCIPRTARSIPSHGRRADPGLQRCGCSIDADLAAEPVNGAVRGQLLRFLAEDVGEYPVHGQGGECTCSKQLDQQAPSGIIGLS